MLSWLRAEGRFISGHTYLLSTLTSSAMFNSTCKHSLLSNVLQLKAHDPIDLRCARY